MTRLLAHDPVRVNWKAFDLNHDQPTSGAAANDTQSMAVQPNGVHAGHSRAENRAAAERPSGRLPHSRRGGEHQPHGLQECRRERAGIRDPHAWDPVQ